MAITSTEQFFNAQVQKLFFRKNAISSSGNSPTTAWQAGGMPTGATLAVGNTTTGVLFDDSYTGAFELTAFASGATGYIRSARLRQNNTGSLWLYDRLWGAGAISLTSLATTTFSGQPSYTGRLLSGPDYTGLDVFLEFTASVSATATTVTVGYTNELGTPGRSSGAVTVTSFGVNRLYAMPLQDGDKGVSQIESVTVGGTVATAGACNVIVGRRLASLHSEVDNISDSANWDLLGMPQVFDTSCLWLVPVHTLNTTGVLSLELEIING